METFVNWDFQNFCLIFLMRQGCFFSTPSSMGVNGIGVYLFSPQDTLLNLSFHS